MTNNIIVQKEREIRMWEDGKTPALVSNPVVT